MGVRLLFLAADVSVVAANLPSNLGDPPLALPDLPLTPNDASPGPGLSPSGPGQYLQGRQFLPGPGLSELLLNISH